MYLFTFNNIVDIIIGPTSLVQFHIWSCGDIEMSVLKEKLILSLKHALCDVMMEYYLLTAPICEIPKCVQELAPLPTMSAPSSPFYATGILCFNAVNGQKQEKGTTK